MQTPELTNTQALIDRYYTEEKERKEQALSRASLNIQLEANDLAMLNIIAKRFDKSRDELAKDVLSNALIDLLAQLEPGERKLIARDADEMGNSMAREIAEENGLKEIDHKPNIWTGHERNITRAEKKRAKELEEARKAEKTPQSSKNAEESLDASNSPQAQETTDSHSYSSHENKQSDSETESLATTEATAATESEETNSVFA